jgi:hypothetical protein
VSPPKSSLIVHREDDKTNRARLQLPRPVYCLGMRALMGVLVALLGAVTAFAATIALI